MVKISCPEVTGIPCFPIVGTWDAANLWFTNPQAGVVTSRSVIATYSGAAAPSNLALQLMITAADIGPEDWDSWSGYLTTLYCDGNASSSSSLSIYREHLNIWFNPASGDLIIPGATCFSLAIDCVSPESFQPTIRMRCPKPS